MSDISQIRSAEWQPVAIFYDFDFPSTASHVPQPTYGYSLYKGVLVQWDEDQDTRVLQFLDALPVHLREQLLIVQERKGCIDFVWDYHIPEKYEKGGEIEVVGDVWSILSSRAIRSFPNAQVLPDAFTDGKGFDELPLES